ncbi:MULTISPECIES: hypothetical protein [unclassified Devosia]|uniref:hypothetical protein n=1 Tax=unclassified Devosia TaxID=196773 RepID=UPI000FDA8D35|nr:MULTISPECIES: hypothetical protein [unclassified Devosia]
MPASPRRPLLFISNGHGEDGIAAAIIARLPDGMRAEAYPMIGAGNAYAGICPIVGPRATLASEGWRNVKGSLRRDVASGGLAIIPPALRFMRQCVGQYERVVVVGDMVGVLAGLVTGHRDLFYLDVYKTGAARLYSVAERWAIKRTCRIVFSRSPKLSKNLQALDIDARCAGNIMMDTVPDGAYDAAARRTRPLAVTLLPGSRQLTPESFALQVAALRTLPEALRPDVFLAVAGSVNIDELARAADLGRIGLHSHEANDLGTLGQEGLTIHLARGAALGSLLENSDLVLSQAGTATVQALGMGKPVITFINARDRRSRFNDEQNLFGEARTVVAPQAAAIGDALRDLLEDSDKRAQLGALGRERIGPPGAIAAVLAALAED